MAGKTALVTGATGFLGGALALRLAGEGVQVRALARRLGKAGFLQDIASIEVVEGNIQDAGRMREVAQGCDYVFHVAAALGGSLEKQRPANVDGTRNVMLAAADAKARRVVHVSSIAVYGYAQRADVTEDTPQQPGNVPYNVTKSEAEKVVREVAAERGQPYSIIRPGMIYGPGSNGWTLAMFHLGRRRPTLFLGSGGGKAHPIYLDDVLDMTILLATHPAAEGEAFNCAPDPAPTWREFVGGYSRLAGHQSWRGIPVLPVRVIAPLLELIFRIRGEPQDLPQLIPFMTGGKSYKMDKARDLLGWQPQVSLEDGIQRCAPWLRERGLLV